MFGIDFQQFVLISCRAAPVNKIVSRVIVGCCYQCSPFKNLFERIVHNLLFRNFSFHFVLSIARLQDKQGEHCKYKNNFVFHLLCFFQLVVKIEKKLTMKTRCVSKTRRVSKKLPLTKTH